MLHLLFRLLNHNRNRNLLGHFCAVLTVVDLATVLVLEETTFPPPTTVFWAEAWDETVVEVLPRTGNVCDRGIPWG
jgi:hypothetical protein